MRKLEKFHILEKNEMSTISGAKEVTSQCGTFEVTCNQNCEDREWVHYSDGIETWRTKTVLTSDCN